MRWRLHLALWVWLSALVPSSALALIHVAALMDYGPPAQSPRSLEVVGHHAYVADIDSGLRIIDVSDPADPRQIGDVAGVSARDIEVGGDFAYVLVYGFGLRIFDVSDPTAPVEVGSFAITTPDRLEVADGVAYVSSLIQDFPMRIVDVSNPFAPVELSSIDARGESVVVGERLYVADARGLRIFDVSDPSAPVQIQSLPQIRALEIEIANGRLYVTEQSRLVSRLRIFDLSDPARPSEIGAIDVAEPGDVEVVGGLAYLGGDRLRVVDVADPAAPALLGSFVAPFRVFDVEIAGGYAYVAALVFGGFRVIDVSHPTRPAEIGADRTSFFVGEVAVGGERAYLVDDIGIRIVDVSDPTAPTTLGSIECRAADVEVSGDLVYVSDVAAGLRIFDAADPGAPVELFRLGKVPLILGGEYEIEVADGLVYLALGYAGVFIFDVADPRRPRLVGAASSVDAKGIAVADGLLYIAEGGYEGGLRIVDVSDPSSPMLVGYLTLPESSAIEVAGGRVYVSDWWGLRIIDVTDPTAPVEVGGLPSRNEVHDIEIENGLVYLAMEDLAVVDVSDPAAPVELGAFGGRALGVAVAEGLVYAAAGIGGLHIIDFGPEYGNQAPVADAGPDQSLECASPSGTEVVLDGSASFDPDDDPLAFRWSGSFGAVEGATSVVELPLGAQTISLEVEDGRGGIGTDEIEIRVEDTRVPRLAVALDPIHGKSRRHRGGHAFRVQMLCIDVCDPSPQVEASFGGRPVTNGQIVRVPEDDDSDSDSDERSKKHSKRSKHTKRHSRKHADDMRPVLEASCTDASGNTAHATAATKSGKRRKHGAAFEWRWWTFGRDRHPLRR